MRFSTIKMGKNWRKFTLLMWKNWVLQMRHPIQTSVEILAPVLLASLLVLIRSLVDPTQVDEISFFKPFSPKQINGTLFSSVSDQRIYMPLMNSSHYPTKFKPRIRKKHPQPKLPPGYFKPRWHVISDSNRKLKRFNWYIAWSPNTPVIEDLMNNTIVELNSLVSNMTFHSKPFQNKLQMSNELVKREMRELTLTGIAFEDSIATTNKLPSDVKVTFRFPAELRLLGNETDWRTNLRFPTYQMPGPREKQFNQGGLPSYWYEGFLLLQTLIFESILGHYGKLDEELPEIMLQRFPYPGYTQDDMLDAMKRNVPLLMMVSFVYTCISTVKVITMEKERQLKESMKIMGLPNWLHWTAWFLKSFLFLMITVVLIVILLKVPWYQGTDLSVFSNSDASLLLVFYICYMIASICFCFMVSAFFNKANLASLLAGLLWFLSYMPFMFLAEHYENLDQVTKLASSLCSNSAMAFGFQLFLMAEGTGEGMQWRNFWKPVTKDDDFVLGHVLLILLVDALIYFLITLYVEAVFPGEYGVPQKWYFPLQKSYWCGNKDVPHLMTDNGPENSDLYEAEPKNLPAGIQIKHLTKIFHKKVAVRNMYLNMYEGHITVLLGHNGAGKTTTMSMLTGMITPTSGTALVGGYDIRTDIQKVRESIGFCPQHNILFEELTVREHLYFFSKLKGLKGNALETEIRKYIRMLELEPKEHAQSQTLSGGMKRKLAAGVALCGGSKIVLFDEPTSGLDPAARRALWDLLEAEKEGRTMLLSTHFMDEADLLGDRIAIMAGGDLQCCGSSFFLKKKYGAGYHLIIVKGPHCNVNAVTNILQEFIADIKVNQNIGSELTYLLNEHHSSVFEPMLSKLEDNQDRLGLLSYGVSLTTMEEVFMKIGKDADVSTAGTEMTFVNGIDNIVYSGSVEIEDSTILPNDTKCFASYFKQLYTFLGNSGSNIVSVPNYAVLKGIDLFWNQLLAMYMKKIIYVWRTWYITLIQILLPSFFLAIAIVAVRSWLRLTELEPMIIDLKGYGETFTPIELNQNSLKNLASTYQNFTSGFYIREENITEFILRQSEEDLQTVRDNNIVGVTFDGTETGTITGWFNNLPYHSVPLSIGLIHNSILSQRTNTTMSVTNHPLPYSDDTKTGFEAWTGNILGFQVGFSLGFSMAFVTAFFIIFYIKERVSKAKHLQAVSGVHVLTFWSSAFVWDMFLFLVPALAVVLTFVAFQEDGFRTSSELGRVFLVITCFGWSILPATYLCSFLFKVPLTGFTRMTMVNLVIGVAAYLTVTIMKIPSLKLNDVAKVLDWIFIFCPHYSFCSSIHNLYSNYANGKTCRTALQLPLSCIRPSVCCKDNCHPDNGCVEWTDNYFDWEVPGIGRNIFFFMVDGILGIILLVLVEYRVFERAAYYIQQRRVRKHADDDVEEEVDSDVMTEKIKIHTSHTGRLIDEYDLVLKDVTKYYKNFLAVDKLCLAVKKGECFGLLGVNGAGKTTTFKMMTGDQKISAGEGFVCGLDLKKDMKKVHQMIGYCPQFDAVLEEMTGKETLTMFCLLRGIPLKCCDTIIDRLTEELLLRKHINKKIKQYSGGNKRKLSTAIALIGDPPIIYLDEPTTGMDPVAKRHLWNVICKMRDSGKCIILTSHSMEECEALCTRIAIMVNGQFKCLGSTQHLKNKFAKGYTLTVKVKKISRSSSESFNTSSQSIVSRDDLHPVKAFIEESFPGAVLMEEFQGLLTYSITNSTLTWSKMFGIMERAKSHLNIEDYSVGQTSLEQVFLTFTKKQRED